jgi:predicted glutamine amidotransferase
MCRLIAIINQENNKEVADLVLREFGALSKSGVVPPNTDAGHKDGWGIAAYKKGDLVLVKKDPMSAADDAEYQTAMAQVREIGSDLILGHLRKASRGAIALENTQPYAFDKYTFCHNGTLRDFEKLELEQKYLARRKGTTDSESVFLYLLQKIEAAGNFALGFTEGIRHMRTMDYTGLNILMSDGKTLLALREANESDVQVKNNNLCDSYYTLFQGKDIEGITRFVCSQALDIPSVAWTEISNHHLYILDLNTKKEDIIEL